MLNFIKKLWEIVKFPLYITSFIIICYGFFASFLSSNFIMLLVFTFLGTLWIVLIEKIF